MSGELVERLRVIAPESGTTICCADRTTREMNRDIREAAALIEAQAAEIEGLTDRAADIAAEAVEKWCESIKGFWTREDIAEDLPGFVRGHVRTSLTDPKGES